MNRQGIGRNGNEHGFSMMEIIVAIAIVSLLLATLITVFARSNQVYTKQNSSVALQQEMRAAMEIMTMEIRMAGYNPNDVSSSLDSKSKNYFGVKEAETGKLRFTVDWDGDDPDAEGINGGSGEIAKDFNDTGDCEDRTFRFSSADFGGDDSIQMICGEKAGESLIGGKNSLVQVTDLKFEYYDGEDDDPMPASKLNKITSNPKRVKGINITIKAKANAGGLNAPVENTYKSFVSLRNM